MVRIFVRVTISIMSEEKAGVSNKRKHSCIPADRVHVRASPKLAQLRAKRVKRFVMAVPRLPTIFEPVEPAAKESDKDDEDEDQEQDENEIEDEDEPEQIESREVRWRREHEERLSKLLKDVFKLAEMEERYKARPQTEVNKKKLASVQQVTAETMQELSEESERTWETEQVLAAEEEKEFTLFMTDKFRAKVEYWTAQARNMSKTPAYREAATKCRERAKSMLLEFEKSA